MSKIRKPLITTTQRIIEELEYQSRPMSCKEIAETLGLDPEKVSGAIRSYRLKGKYPTLRVAGLIYGSGRYPARLYERSDEPDCEEFIVEEDNQAVIDERDRERVKKLADMVKPFRDPMLFLTCGVRP